MATKGEEFEDKLVQPENKSNEPVKQNGIQSQKQEHEMGEKPRALKNESQNTDDEDQNPQEKVLSNNKLPRSGRNSREQTEAIDERQEFLEGERPSNPKAKVDSEEEDFIAENFSESLSQDKNKAQPDAQKNSEDDDAQLIANQKFEAISTLASEKDTADVMEYMFTSLLNWQNEYVNVESGSVEEKMAHFEKGKKLFLRHSQDGEARGYDLNSFNVAILDADDVFFTDQDFDINTVVKTSEIPSNVINTKGESPVSESTPKKKESAKKYFTRKLFKKIRVKSDEDEVQLSEDEIPVEEKSIMCYFYKNENAGEDSDFDNIKAFLKRNKSWVKQLKYKNEENLTIDLNNLCLSLQPAADDNDQLETENKVEEEVELGTNEETKPKILIDADDNHEVKDATNSENNNFDSEDKNFNEDISPHSNTVSTEGPKSSSDASENSTKKPSSLPESNESLVKHSDSPREFTQSATEKKSTVIETATPTSSTQVATDGPLSATPSPQITLAPAANSVIKSGAEQPSVNPINGPKQTTINKEPTTVTNSDNGFARPTISAGENHSDTPVSSTPQSPSVIDQSNQDTPSVAVTPQETQPRVNSNDNSSPQGNPSQNPTQDDPKPSGSPPAVPETPQINQSPQETTNVHKETNEIETSTGRPTPNENNPEIVQRVTNKTDAPFRAVGPNSQINEEMKEVANEVKKELIQMGVRGVKIDSCPPAIVLNFLRDCPAADKAVTDVGPCYDAAMEKNDADTTTFKAADNKSLLDNLNKNLERLMNTKEDKSDTELKWNVVVPSKAVKDSVLENFKSYNENVEKCQKQQSNILSVNSLPSLISPAQKTLVPFAIGDFSAVLVFMAVVIATLNVLFATMRL